ANLSRWVAGNGGGRGWGIAFGQEGKSSFRSWLPAEPAESFPNHFLVDSQPCTNPAIAQASGLQAQNGTGARRGLGRCGVCRSSLRTGQGVQSARAQAALEAAQSSR